MKYKILHIMLNTGRGGMEHAFVDYTKALGKFSETVAVVHSRCRVKTQLLKLGVNVVELNGYSKFFASALKLRKIAKDHKIDVVLAHGDEALTLARLGLMQMGIKIISVRHTFFKSKFAMLTWCLKSDISIGVNKRITAATSRIGKSSHLVYNAIEANVENIEQKSCLLKMQKPIRIGFLGRVVERKGPQFLIKALGLLSGKSNINYELYFGGEGRYMKALKNLAFMHGLRDKVHFLGYVEDKQHFFKNIDIFCLPSLNEAFGIVLIESMAYGVPVIASDIQGINEVVIHGHNGLLFKPGDYHDLAGKIETLVFDIRMRHKLIDNAFEIWKDRYHLGRLTEDLQLIVSDAVEEM